MPPRNALEIGCGSGANLAELRHRYTECRTTGIELHTRAAAVAKRRPEVDCLVHGDVLDRTGVNFESCSFDLVIMSHVLEHFSDPEKVIERALDWMHPHGHLLVALPNIRHASVIIDLLFRGDFPYSPLGGILDQTHLRFYTRKSATRFFVKAGLKVLRSSPDFDGVKSRLLLQFSLGFASDLSAFAYNFLLCRRERI